jgi:hypothetical protein
MDLASTLAHLRVRIPFHQAKDYLGSKQIPGAIGWDAMIGVVLTMNPPLSLQTVGELHAALLDSHIVGRKSVSIYELSHGTMSALRKAVASRVVTSNPFSDLYPYSLSDVNAANAPPDSDWLEAGVVSRPQGTGLVFSAIRSYEIRAPIDYSQLPKAARDVLDEYEEVVGLTKVRSQVFDSLWVPASGDRIAILVDQPEGVGKGFVGAGHAALRKFVETTFRVRLTPIDISNAVSGLYSTSGDGTVVELAFTTDASGVKSAKMRKKNTCIRTDLFQVGGEAAVNKLVYAYRIGVRWALTKSKKFISEPEIFIDGKARMLALQGGRLYQASLHKLWDVADLQFVLGKLNKHT